MARDQQKPPRVRTRDVVAEGLYIASAATRLALKNKILVHILAEGEGFDSAYFLPEARETLLTLAAEAEHEADRVDAERKRAKRRHSDSDGTHDYRSRDSRNLRRRSKQSRHVAQQLRARAEDEAELGKLVTDAREAAWAEVAKNIDRTLRIEAARPDLEPDYAQMRMARMQALRLVDLPKLRSHRRSVDAQTALRESGEAPAPVERAADAGVIDPGELE